MFNSDFPSIFPFKQPLPFSTMSYPRETILSTSSLSPYPTSSTAPTSSTPKTASPSSITLHDLQTSTQIHSFKPSNSLNQGVGVVNSEEGRGGGVFVVQEGKALLNFWAWQRVRLSTFLCACSVSIANGMDRL